MTRKQRQLSELSLFELLRMLDAVDFKVYILADSRKGSHLPRLNKALHAFRRMGRRGNNAKAKRLELLRSVAAFRKLLDKATSASKRIPLILAEIERRVQTIESKTNK